jgi:import inner membrane translocase subunit TIM23
MAGVWIARPLPQTFGCTGRRLVGRPTLISRAKSTSTIQPREAATKKLNWQEYLAIRGGKRRWQTVGDFCVIERISLKRINQAFTIPCALIGFFGGATYFGTLETDPTKPIMASSSTYHETLVLTKSTGYRPVLLLRLLHRGLCRCDGTCL